MNVVYRNDYNFALVDNILDSLCPYTKLYVWSMKYEVWTKEDMVWFFVWNERTHFIRHFIQQNNRTTNNRIERETLSLIWCACCCLFEFIIIRVLNCICHFYVADVAVVVACLSFCSFVIIYALVDESLCIGFGSACFFIFFIIFIVFRVSPFCSTSFSF